MWEQRADGNTRVQVFISHVAFFPHRERPVSLLLMKVNES